MIIEQLKSQGDLLFAQQLSHSYPHCWRCKKPIIFRATHQWFLNVDHNDLRHRLIKETDNVQWVPPSGKERMRGMLELRPDWCLSRQRLWGVPIPALKCNSCQEIILDAGVIDTVAGVVREQGSDAWFSAHAGTFIPEGFACPHCASGDFSKEADILDVWFESGASFAGVVKNNETLRFPADMYLEGSDQHRGWFQVSLIPSVAKEQQAPFKAILTHGFVVDGEGRKMSKSIGNVISPQKVIDTHGAEILRLWCAGSDYSEDVRLSDEILKQLVDVYRKVRNTIRFILGNLYDFDSQRDTVKEEELSELDRFMLHRARSAFAQILAEYEDYQFYKVCQKVFDFCNIDLSSFYLDILKDRLYTYSPTSAMRRSAQTVLCYILQELLKFIAPILSATAEDGYMNFESIKDREKSIFLCCLKRDYAHCDQALLDRWEKILTLRDEVLKELEAMRERGIIGSSLEAEVTISRQTDYDSLKAYEDALAEVFIVSSVTIEKGKPAVTVKKSDGQKCARCWNWRHDIGSRTEHPEICPRCSDAIKGGS